MKKFLLLISVLSTAFTALQAQLADGYYRVKNVGTERFIYLTDNKGSVDLVGANIVHDLDAIVLRKNIANTISDANSIIYVKKTGGANDYDLSAQGTSVKKMAGGYPIVIKKEAAGYTVGATKSGVSALLGDNYSSSALTPYEYGIIDTRAKGINNNWDAMPVDENSDNYFGLVPTVETKGANYASFYADFGFKPASSGMQVYCISQVDEANGAVCMKEITEVVPNSTPVIVACSSTEATNNRLSLSYNTSKLPFENKLTGNYFNSSNKFLADGFVPEAPAGKEKYFKYTVKLHENKTAYDPSTMRILGLDPKGKLAFIKANIDYLPANSAYLKVSAGAPDCLLVLSEDDYNNLSALDNLELESSDNEIYNLLGKKISSKGNLPAGIYIINGKKTVIR